MVIKAVLLAIAAVVMVDVVAALFVVAVPLVVVLVALVALAVPLVVVVDELVSSVIVEVVAVVALVVVSGGCWGCRRWATVVTASGFAVECGVLVVAVFGAAPPPGR